MEAGKKIRHLAVKISRQSDNQAGYWCAFFFTWYSYFTSTIYALFVCIRDLSEDLITDNAIHSDLDPLEAPEWSVSVALLDRPDCLLAKHLDAFLQLCADQRTAKQLLGDLAEELEEADGRRLPDVLDRMAGQPSVALPSVSLSDLASKVRPLRRSRTPTGGPLKQELLQTVLSYLFPDAGQGSTTPYPSELNIVSINSEDTGGHAQLGRELYIGAAKTGPSDGLVVRMAKSLACCLGWGGGAAGAAHLLHEFVLEVRYRWENGQPLPGLGPVGSVPDTGAALLHQKLQMINCCIARRNAGNNKAGASRPEEEEDKHDSDTDYEEFFDAEDEDEEEEAKKGTKNGLAAWETAEGREERVGQLRLLSDLDWLYRPVLQEPAPLTEDQLAEQVRGQNTGTVILMDALVWNWKVDILT